MSIAFSLENIYKGKDSLYNKVNLTKTFNGNGFVRFTKPVNCDNGQIQHLGVFKDRKTKDALNELNMNDAEMDCEK